MKLLTVLSPLVHCVFFSYAKYPVWHRLPGLSKHKFISECERSRFTIVLERVKLHFCELLY
jgi:hypothetical protein